MLQLVLCQDSGGSSSSASLRALFREQYRPFEYTPIREAFEFKDVLHSVRDITPYNCLEFRYRRYFSQLLCKKKQFSPNPANQLEKNIFHER